MTNRTADGKRGVLEETKLSTRVAAKQPVPLGQRQLSRLLYPKGLQKEKSAEPYNTFFC